MSNLKPSQYLRIIIPLLIGMGLLFVPLLGDFHIESAILISLTGCFWAAIKACENPNKRSDFFSAIQVLGYLFLVGLPLFITALITGCFSIHGLAFWLLLPLPSVFFGYSIGRLLRFWEIPYRKLISVIILLFVAVGILLYELLTYPQVYFFNHVWGAWPGPIYDEVIQVNGATVFFRVLTLLWAALLWHIPTFNWEQYAKWIVGFAAISIALSYGQFLQFGIISPRDYLQNVLGGHKSTEHFDLYYDDDFYSEYEVNLLAKEHEFYLKQISDQLNLSKRDSTNKIESYLYAHPWQKKKLVGAKFTSYVPVWLRQDQLHIAKQQIPHSLKHELVHIAAKEFGNDLFNASWSIGLIEGIAVAIDGGSSATSTIDQIVVSEKPYPTAKELQQAFSPWGFYGGRSGVNYITSGSFVRFLMDNYSVDSLKEAYRSGSISTAYTDNWQKLTANWHQHLDSVKVDSVDRQIASRIFAIPSLFEQQCPHLISEFALLRDSYRFHQANRDTAKALEYLNRAIAEADSFPPIKAEWTYQHLVHGDYNKIQNAATVQDTTVNLQLLYADAYALADSLQHARAYISRAEALFTNNPDSLLKPALTTRQDSLQWAIYRQMTYHNNLPDSSTFSRALYRTKIRSVRKAIQYERWKKVKMYVGQLLNERLQLIYFDDYERLIHHLAFQGERKRAIELAEKLVELPLRQRYYDRLQQEIGWVNYLESRSD